MIKIFMETEVKNILVLMFLMLVLIVVVKQCILIGYL